MKTSIIALTLLSLAVFSANAQDNRKVRNDATYSTHNYKHPNKAAAAKRWNNDKSLDVTAPATTVNQLANYKHQSPNLTPAGGGVVLPHTPQTDVALRNYKIQRVSQPVTESAQLITTKPQIKESSTGN